MVIKSGNSMSKGDVRRIELSKIKLLWPVCKAAGEGNEGRGRKGAEGWNWVVDLS